MIPVRDNTGFRLQQRIRTMSLKHHTKFLVKFSTLKVLAEIFRALAMSSAQRGCVKFCTQNCVC